MKTLVVYYSRDGLTKKTALSLADLLQADNEELIDLTNRRGIWGWLFAGRDAMKRKLTRLKPTEKRPENYDLVVIGSPVWASNVAPAVRTYLSEHAGQIKRAAFFCSKGGSPAKNLFPEMAAAAGGLKPLATLEIKEADDKTGAATHKILQFVAEIKQSA